jgi:hypothetical protein
MFVPQKISDSELETAMLCGRRRTHDDLPVPIRFNPTLDFGEFRVGQQFVPAAEVQSRLLWLRR